MAGKHAHHISYLEDVHTSNADAIRANDKLVASISSAVTAMTAHIAQYNARIAALTAESAQLATANEYIGGIVDTLRKP